jgi:signal transduction histidine kinase
LQAALQQANRDLEKRVRERTAELQQALNRLGELNQLKSNFIANISHELRTPLTHIRGYIELMLEEDLGPLTDQQVAALEVVGRSEMRLEQLIEDLIQFSLAARGEFELELKPTNLKKVMGFVRQQSTKKIKDKSISLHVELPEDLPEVQADSSKLIWSISQLVDNAIKFTPVDGRITLGARVEGPLVVVYVDDNGIGIPEQKVKEIFEPFYQLDGSSTRRTGGTGLGLALVQRIVEAHGSHVKVRTRLGEGSRFEFAIAKADDGQYV